MPDAAWITQERFDNLTERELYGTINGAPDFRGGSPFPQRPAAAAAVKNGGVDGSRRPLGWMLDAIDRRVYIFRPGREMEILEDPAVLDGEDVLPGFTFEVGRLMFGHE